MSDFDIRDLIEAHKALRRDHEALRRQYDNTFVQGPVVERDHEKGVRIGRDPKGEHKSDWVQPADLSGRSRALPDKGENVLLLHPHGDPRQGVVLGLGHSDAKKNPAKDAANTVLHDKDGVRIEAQGDTAILTAKTITLKADDVTVTITGSGVAITGGKVTHEGKDIGATHKHGGVDKGSAQTDPPI